MSEFTDEILNILILNDVNASNSMKLQSILSENNEKLDIIILCMNEKNKLDNEDNIKSLIPLVEKLCNKVLCLYNEKLDSEGNNIAMNINGTKVLLNEKLYIAGYDEHATDLKDINSIVEDTIDDDMLEEQEMIRQQFNIDTAETTTQTINEILSSDNSNQYNGIFVFNYKYTHSLNKFLFYPEIVNTDDIRLLIIPSMSDEASRLPKSYGNYQILVPKSFSTTGVYHKIVMKSLQNQWTILDINECTIVI